MLLNWGELRYHPAINQHIFEHFIPYSSMYHDKTVVFVGTSELFDILLPDEPIPQYVFFRHPDDTVTVRRYG